MKSAIITVACVAFLCSSVSAIECKKRNCYQWPNCQIQFNETRCACEAIFEGNDSECPPLPCISNGFCFGIRLARNRCKCFPVCKDPPYCPYGYQNCRRWDDCPCKEKERLFNWSDEESEESTSHNDGYSGSVSSISDMLLDYEEMQGS